MKGSAEFRCRFWRRFVEDRFLEALADHCSMSDGTRAWWCDKPHQYLWWLTNEAARAPVKKGHLPDDPRKLWAESRRRQKRRQKR